MIEFKHIYKNYDQVNILEDINLEIKQGEFIVLVGPSGSGKTTLLKMINGLAVPTKGEILIDNQPLPPSDWRTLRLEIGYVIQQIALFPNLTILENISIIPKMKKWDKDKIKKLSSDLLQQVGMPADEYLYRYPKELSGGQQQRVGIIRAIITNPKILLMDEPFSALDAISRKQLQILIKKLHTQFKTTSIFVTHDTNEALTLADKIAVLHDGKIIQFDTPQKILQAPQTPFVKKLFEEGTYA